MKIKKLSRPQIRLLTNLRDTQPINGHCTCQSDYGGLHGTVFWAIQRGYINRKQDRLTAAGKKALEAGRG